MSVSLVYNGHHLISGGKTVRRLEWNPDGIIVIKFPSIEDFKRFPSLREFHNREIIIFVIIIFIVEKEEECRHR